MKIYPGKILTSKEASRRGRNTIVLCHGALHAAKQTQSSFSPLKRIKTFKNNFLITKNVFKTY